MDALTDAKRSAQSKATAVGDQRADGWRRRKLSEDASFTGNLIRLAAGVDVDGPNGKFEPWGYSGGRVATHHQIPAAAAEPSERVPSMTADAAAAA